MQYMLPCTPWQSPSATFRYKMLLLLGVLWGWLEEWSDSGRASMAQLGAEAGLGVQVTHNRIFLCPSSLFLLCCLILKQYNPKNPLQVWSMMRGAPFQPDQLKWAPLTGLVTPLQSCPCTEAFQQICSLPSLNLLGLCAADAARPGQSHCCSTSNSFARKSVRS